MTFWIAIGFAATCGLFSIWLWFWGYRWSARFGPSSTGGVVHTPASIRAWAIFVAVFGLVGTVFMLWVNAQGRTTLYESEVAGTIGLKAGDDAARRSTFIVEHGGVRHTVQIWPKEGDDAAFAKKNWGDVPFVVKISGPDGSDVLAERVIAKDGKGAELTFTPRRTGVHTLTFGAVKAGIPKIHILISDPQKKDGKRMKGY